jgi:hypothetical protein
MSTENTFVKDLQRLINRHSMENGSNTPDFLLASFLMEVLKSVDDLIRARDYWYGVQMKPGQDNAKKAKEFQDSNMKIENFYNEEKAKKLAAIYRTPYAAALGDNAPVIENGLRYKVLNQPDFTDFVEYVLGTICYVRSYRDTTPHKSMTFKINVEKLKGMFNRGEALVFNEEMGLNPIISPGLVFTCDSMPGKVCTIKHAYETTNLATVEIENQESGEKYFEYGWDIKNIALSFKHRDFNVVKFSPGKPDILAHAKIVSEKAKDVIFFEMAQVMDDMARAMNRVAGYSRYFFPDIRADQERARQTPNSQRY